MLGTGWYRTCDFDRSTLLSTPSNSLYLVAAGGAHLPDTPLPARADKARIGVVIPVEDNLFRPTIAMGYDSIRNKNPGIATSSKDGSSGAVSQLPTLGPLIPSGMRNAVIAHARRSSRIKDGSGGSVRIAHYGHLEYTGTA